MKIGSRRKLLSALLLIVTFITLQINAYGQEIFNYKKYLFDKPSTLSLIMESKDINSGYVKMNGTDLGTISAAFTWDWGDGTHENGWFPKEHTYSNVSRNYILKVIANYSGGLKDTAEKLIRFIVPSISPITLSDTFAVHIPDNVTILNNLGTRLYPPPTTLTFFSDNFFRLIPRATLEYILTASAGIQRDFCNDRLHFISGKFEQYMFRDSPFNGAYSLWFTNPVAFGVGDVLMDMDLDFSSLFHELGNNTTLNTPADFYYGGKVDGNANEIYSKSLGQIFQHSTGYEIVNNYENYGLSEDLMIEIRQELIRTLKLVRSKYDQYLGSGKPFASWDDPSTSADETFLTFMTIAYKFCEHAENLGQGYRLPTKRMMNLLQGFCQDWADRYDRLHNTAKADTFRSTLMVTALSYAFSSDLRQEFRNLNFPVDDQIYAELYNTVINSINDFSDSSSDYILFQNFPNPFNNATTITWQLPEYARVVIKIYDLMGREVKVLVDSDLERGEHKVEFNAKNLPAGIYYYQLKANGLIETKKMILLK